MGRFSRRFSVRLTAIAATAAVGTVAYDRWSLRRGSARSALPDDSVLPPVLPRAERWGQLCRNSEADPFDVLVVGGGVIGLYTAVDAAQRGLRVALVEAGDFGGGRSSHCPTVMPGAFPYVQRAVRQRDLSWLWRGMEELRASTVWRNVAPHCTDDGRPTKTLLPALHTMELVELLSAAAVSTLVSPLCGPVRWCWPTRERSVQPVVPDACGGVVVSDSTLDGARAVYSLARTAEALGVTVLNYAPLQGVDYLHKQEAPKEGEGRSNSSSSSLLFCATVHNLESERGVRNQATVCTRSVVNCTGSWVDLVRETFVDNATDVVPAAFERHYVNSYLVAPREALLSKTREALQLPGGASALQVSSTLYSFSASLVLPWTDGCSLLGPSISPATLPTVVRSSWKTKDDNRRPIALRSQDGFKAQKRRIVEILETCGVTVDSPRILSCLSHLVPVMKDHHQVPWVGEMLYRTYHITVSQPALPAEPISAEEAAAAEAVVAAPVPNGPPLPFVHVYGGTTSLARTIAEEAVDCLIQQTHCFTAEQKQQIGACRTKQLKLACPSAWQQQQHHQQPSASTTDTPQSEVVTEEEAVNRLRSLITDTYVEHLDDVLFRRTRFGYTSPAEALAALPAIAAMVAAERGWSDKRRESEVRACKALLRELAVH